MRCSCVRATLPHVRVCHTHTPVCHTLPSLSCTTPPCACAPTTTKPSTTSCMRCRSPPSLISKPHFPINFNEHLNHINQHTCDWEEWAGAFKRVERALAQVQRSRYKLPPCITQPL